MEQNIEEQYSIACEQYQKTKSEIRQLKDKLKKETNSNRLKKLRHNLLEKKQILRKNKKKENILFKTHKSYEKQQKVLKFKNMMHYRLKRIFQNNNNKYSINHIHAVNKIINDMCKNKNEQEIYMTHMQEKEKPVILYQIYSNVRQRY